MPVFWCVGQYLVFLVGRVDSLSTQVFQRCRVPQVDCEAAGRNFPFSSLFAQLLGFSFGFGPTSVCRLPSGFCSSPDRTGLLQWLIRGLWLTQARRREGYGMQSEPAVAEASMTLQQPEVHRVFSWGSCSWIMGPWQ